MRKHSYLFILIAMIWSCKKESSELSKAGYFVLNQVQSSTLKSASAIQAENSFDLGNIKASREFYFLLSNGGEYPIFDIEFSSDPQSFIISPNKIDKLDGTVGSNGNQIIPLISLGILHGLQLNGIGYANLLPMGENNGTIEITGKTIENGDTIPVSASYSFNVDAKLMDVSLFSGGDIIDLELPTGRVSGMGGDYLFYKVARNQVEIKNTGNVDVNVKIIGSDQGQEVLLQNFVLSQDELKPIDLNNRLTLISLDGNGTITDNSKIETKNDGFGYIAIEYYPEN